MFLNARCLLAVLTMAGSGWAVSAAAQIMTGEVNRPKDRSGNWNAPTMITLDTDVGTRSPTFRASVTRVEVSARVVDASGRPIRDLEPDEIEIFDNGRKQKVMTFIAYSRAASPIPMDTLSPADARATAVGTNSWAGTSRLIALVIDDLHIDARYAERARDAARQLVAELAPSDLLYVGLTSTPGESTQAFTRDRTRALAIIERFGGMRLMDSAQELRQLHALSSTAAGLSVADQQRSMRLVDAYDTIQRVATAARSVRGRRKSLVFMSQGSQTGATQASATALTPEAPGAMLNAVAAATVADVAIYPLNPAGLDLPTDRMSEGFTRAVDDAGREVAHVDLSHMVAEFLQAKNQLRDLATLTGGVSLIDSNDLTAAIGRVLDDASDHYLISYEPDKAVKGTNVRPIEVRVKRPGARVHARRGYLAPPATPAAESRDGAMSPAMAALLGGIVPEDGVPLLVQLIPAAHVGDRVRYAVVVDAAGGPLMLGVDRGQLTVEHAITGVDRAGRMGKVTHRKELLKLKGAQVDTMRERWVRTVWAVDLDPGEHQVRVAVVQPTTGLAGSMYVDVTATPAQLLDPTALAAAVTNAATPTLFVDPALQDILPASGQ